MGICFSIEQDEQRFQERQLLSSHNSSGVSVGLGVLLLAIFIGWLRKVLRKQRIEKLKKKYFKCNGGFLLQEQLSSREVNVEKVKMFNSKELDKATDHYHVDRMLGQGGQGTVYRGILRNGQIVAVKKLKALDKGNIQQFINEVVIVAQINHRNVVRLLGCCLESEVPLLVYELIPNGNLFQLIHESNEEFTLTWDARLRIAKEVAGALSYLHSAASIPIYHRDVKSTNILLDDKYRAKVADFGTSKFVTIDQTHVTTLVKGTFGYFDPEYFRSSRFTDKSDVYSFGVVLSELLTGEKPIFSMSSGEVRDLAGYFVHAIEENRLFDIIDTQVIGEAKNDEILSVAKLASRCLNWIGKERPTMKEVTMILEDIYGRSRQGLDFSHSSTKTCTPESSSIKRLSISPIPRSVTDLRQSFGDGDVDIFTYKEMALATKQFQRHYIVGEGGFGVVYKGVIDKSVRRGYGTTHVAIRKFNSYGLQGDNEWQKSII